MKTYLIAESNVNWSAIYEYLKYTDQEAFRSDLDEAYGKIPNGLQLCSFAAKLCYKALGVGKNQNVTRTRSIEDNVKAVIQSGHGSVLEHISFTFVSTGVSRIFTHELVRHRVGTAFSQTSGRYCSVNEDSELLIDDPILTEEDKEEMLVAFSVLKDTIQGMRDRHDLDNQSFDIRKKVTSALRRIAPSGMTNEIVWTANLRALRHMIEMRTSPHAEWEIRSVFMEVANLINPAYLWGGTQHEDGSWTGLRV